MTASQLFKVLLLSLLLVCFGCSNDSNTDDEPSVTSIFLSVDQTSIDIGESFTFTVKDNSNNNITSQSTINVNGSPIIESVFTPSTDGSYVVYATYQNLSSSNLNLTVTNSQVTLSSIVLSVDKNEALRNELVTFTVTGNEGSDLTSEATFLVNGSVISDNFYVTDDFGTDIVSATYDTFTSNVEDILVGHTQKVLIEDYTGTWCGYCPRVSYGLEQVENNTDDAVVVAIHRGNSSGAYYDPFNYPAGDLEDYINLSGYPTAKLNRLVTWAYPEPSNINQVLNYTGGVSALGLSINSQLTGSNLDVSIKTNFASGNLNGHKLVVYVLEDGLIQDQVNYTSYYGGTSVINNFVHNNVLRQVPTGLFGEAITSEDYDSDSGSYMKDYNFTLTSEISDVNRLSIAAFIINSNGLAINSQYASVGEDVDFH